MNRSEIYLNLLPLLTSGRVSLLDQPRLAIQLSSLERKASRSGRDSVSPPVGAYDDLANAVAGAVVLAESDQRPALINRSHLLTDGAPVPLPEQCSHSRNAEEKAKKDAEGDEGGGNIDKLLKGLCSSMDAMTKCVDSMSKRLDAMEKKARECSDRARKDAELMNHGTHPLTSAQADEARKADAEKAEIQARADAVATAWGKRAPMPMMGETPFAYRKRMVCQFQMHSPAWKAVDLCAMNDQAAFSVAEEQVYSDALVASRNPPVEGSQYVPRVTYSEGGHKMIRWFGNKTIFKKFSAPTMRVAAFNTPQHVGNH